MKYFRVVMSVTSKSNLLQEWNIEGYIPYKINNDNLTVTEIVVKDTKAEGR